MSIYGNGSDGILNVTSGTHSLSLDRKYQFESVNVAAGATLTTGSTTGSVLYITARESITIDGTINVSNKVTYGDNSWSVIIDGVTYSTPGVAAGGDGKAYAGDTAGVSQDGFGGGGAGSGGVFDGTDYRGGSGGNGGLNPNGGNSVTVTRTSNGTSVNRNDATSSGGGSGVAYAKLDKDGSVSATVKGTGGSGGESFGNNGGSGGGSFTRSGSGSWWYNWYGGGGGGAGGIAGKAGVHVVLKAPEITLNGTIISSGSNGGGGGDGGRNKSWSGWDDYYGNAGGGGGGGNAGDIEIVYSDVLDDSSTKTLNGGLGGGGGAGGYLLSTPAFNGSGGDNGSVSIARSVDIQSGSITVSELELVSEYAYLEISRVLSPSSRFTTLQTFQALMQKDYEIRVFEGDQYISTLQNVESEFNYSQSINQNASELNITVSRSPDNRVVRLSALKDETGDPILDENSDPIYVQTETANAVGPDTDIDINLNVDVYAFWGGYEQLLDENYDPILDENSDPILVPFGAPNGRRVYSGYIADYELVYGRQTQVNVVVVPHATEMSHYIYKSGSNTTVNVLNTDPVLMARNAIDNYQSQGGMITYDATTMPLSGESSDYKFNLQTTREVVDKTIELLPSGYYHYVHPGENKQYLLQKAVTPHHTFYYQKHIKQLNLRQSMTQLKNKVYVVGKDTLFKYYEDATSQTNYRAGLEIISDGRLEDADSALALATKELDTYKTPRYRSTVTITDAVYDIESIRLGQMAGFKNFGTFVDDLVLQIVSVNRKKHEITFDLDMVVPNDTKRLIELKKQLIAQEVASIGSAPS